MDVEDRGGDRGRHQNERDDRADGDPEPLEEPPDAVGVPAGEGHGLGRLVLGAGLREPVPGDEEDRAARERKDDPDVAVRPEGHVRDDHGTRDREQPEPDQRPRPVAALPERARRERVLLALRGHHERRRRIDQDP